MYYRQPSGSTEEVYREYIGRVAGAPTEENLLYISEEESRIKSVLSEHSAVMTAYRNGKLSGDEYAEHMSCYSYAEYCGRACEMLVERRDYILSIPDEYSGVEFIYDRGILLFMKSPADIPALMVVVFIASRIFASERDSGFSYILRASKRGRRETSGAKLAAVTVMSSMVYLVFCAVDLIFLCLNYGTSGFGAGIMSIPEMSYTGLDMSVLGYAVIENHTICRISRDRTVCHRNLRALLRERRRAYHIVRGACRSRSCFELFTRYYGRAELRPFFVRFGCFRRVPVCFGVHGLYVCHAVMRSAELERRKNSFYPLTNERLYAII